MAKTNPVTMAPFAFGTQKVSTAGLVSTTDWILAPDGQQYRTFWCDRWEIVPDAQMPVPGFRSVEKWTAAAVLSGGRVAMLIPGCKVQAWFYCPKPEAKLGTTVYRLTD